jgi:CheY-like chemotaxis protein
MGHCNGARALAKLFPSGAVDALRLGAGHRHTANGQGFASCQPRRFLVPKIKKQCACSSTRTQRASPLPASQKRLQCFRSRVANRGRCGPQWKCRARTSPSRADRLIEGVRASPEAAIEILLGGYAIAVQVAHNGPEGLSIARVFRPEVVLCDIGMPGMDGYEVARGLRLVSVPLTTLAVMTYTKPDVLQQRLEAHGKVTRTMRSYKDIIAKNSTIILSTDSDLFKFLKSMNPDGAGAGSRSFTTNR